MTTIYGHKRIVRPVSGGVLQLEKLLEILVVGILPGVRGDGDLVPICGRGIVSNCVVKLSQTGDGDL